MMTRAPFQVLVFPYRVGSDGQPRYALFRRSDQGIWQGIAGGGEGAETPEQAARREASEEAGIREDARLLRLDSMASIPAVHFREHPLWGPDVHVIPEYSFGVEAPEGEIHLSDEHSECEWLDYAAAHARLRWDSNRTALWELHRRLSGTQRTGCES